MILILFDMSMPMPPSWIFFFVLGSSLPVTQFSQQGRQDNLCWVPLSLFKLSRDGSNPCGSGMPRQTWSTVCCVEVWDGMTLAVWHMLDAACCSCTQFLKAAKPSEAWPSQHVESCAGWAGQCVLPRCHRGHHLCSWAPTCSTEVLLELPELHQCTERNEGRCQMLKPSSCLRTKAGRGTMLMGNMQRPGATPDTSQGMHHTGAG